LNSNNFLFIHKKFISEHYEEDENYREFLKFSCGVKVGQICSFCCEWAGPPIGRCPKPFIVKPKFVFDYLQHLEAKRKKRLEERARESREAREKSYEDYHWANLCEDATKLKKLRVPELNKYLKYHGLLKQHQKSSKNEKV